MQFVIFLAIVSALLAPSSGASAQVCPPDNVLHPCICWEYWKEIQCIGLERNFDLKGHFDNVSSHVGEDVVFQTLQIRATQLEEIKEGAVEHLKFEWLDIMLNSELRYISPRAFGANRDMVTRMWLWGNAKLVDDENTFEFVRSMQAVNYLSLGANVISSIPSNAFQNMGINSSIWIMIENNNISQIGGHAFSGVPKLGLLVINEPSIGSGALNQNAFDGISSRPEVILNNRGVTFLDQVSYQPLLDQVRKVHLGDYEEGQQFHCDERADWICEGQDRYQEKLYGFNCLANEHGYGDIWGYCAGRNTSAYRSY